MDAWMDVMHTHRHMSRGRWGTPPPR